jgi:adenylate kinase family enzyme
VKVAILGNSGSGKSTLAGQLSQRLGVPVLDLDTVAWEPGKIAVPRDPAHARADVEAFCRGHEGWVIEGCYASLIAATLPHEPSLLWLDPGVAACVENCRNRPWEPHKYASKEQQDEKLEFLLQWVRGYDTRDDDMSRSAHRAVYDGYGGAKEHLLQRPPADYRLPG